MPQNGMFCFPSVCVGEEAIALKVLLITAMNFKKSECDV